ncbi:MAG: hypothetical protein IPM55_20980 [Acidobacteria bacterium]|nr:hypothetical protein [Acidobacteriota bacterium]
MRKATRTTPEGAIRKQTLSPRRQVIAVVIKQYGTGLYRTCVSLDKDNLTFISTHKDERSATETINRFWRAYDEGQLKSPEDISILIDKIDLPQVTPPMPPQSPAPAELIFRPLAA